MKRLTFLPALAGLVFILYIVLPVVSIFLNINWPRLSTTIRMPVVLQALQLSGLTTLVATAVTIILGTPLAYFLARRSFPGREVIDTLLDLPLVLPPAVAGVALLMAFGRRGLLGALMAGWGISLPFTTVAVILAQVFVGAPFFLKTARNGFAAVDTSLEAISLTLGKTPLQTFFRVTLPLAFPALFNGAIMTWARALGEFGATIMFAGNMPGVTQTLPLAIYMAMDSNLEAALVMAALLVLVSFAVLLAVKKVARGGDGHPYP
ncbi:ABC transporter permease [Neomoorella thermoacetica]|uniref:ABC transporter permease n=1 Tax=Neomoorella thermoacetica TaxID=1525 RepID=UPI0008FAC76D|nr:ABC transporter permease [Moorella thermoacetica]OIQ11801.1 sulfate transport system permease protein CysT [Moorella thermoacetica]